MIDPKFFCFAGLSLRSAGIDITNKEVERILAEPWSEYCPVCQRVIIAENKAEVEAGEHEGYIFVHDDTEHSDEEIEALQRGIQ